VEAARRVTLLYLGKAAERAIIENEPVQIPRTVIDARKRATGT
jgi:hypothetical protein